MEKKRILPEKKQVTGLMKNITNNMVMDQRTTCIWKDGSVGKCVF